jgi:hypothetical protein
MAFSDKLTEMMNKGMAASREVMSKATAQAQTWGEMGVLKVEVIQLRSQAEKLTAQLGAEVYAAFAERREASIAATSRPVQELVGRISDLDILIKEKEAAFRKLGGKESDLDG